MSKIDLGQKGINKTYLLGVLEALIESEGIRLNREENGYFESLTKHQIAAYIEVAFPSVQMENGSKSYKEAKVLYSILVGIKSFTDKNVKITE